MSNSTRLGKSNQPKIAQSSSVRPGENPASVDPRTALEFSQILQRHGDSESAMQHERESTASAEHIRQNVVNVEQASTAPDLFFRTGGAFIQSQHTDSPESETLSVSESSGHDMPARHLGTVVLPEDNASPKPISIVEVVYKDWLKQEATPSAQTWIVEIATGESTKATLEIEYTTAGDWIVNVTSERDNERISGSGVDDSDSSDSLVWDASAFSIELESRLALSQPELRFSARSAN